MRTALLSAILVWLAAGGAVADEIEPLDGAFLEYLANLEADDSDWTLLAPDEIDQAAPEAKSSERAPDKPAKAPKARKPTKEAADSAAEER